MEVISLSTKITDIPYKVYKKGINKNKIQPEVTEHISFYHFKCLF